MQREDGVTLTTEHRDGDWNNVASCQTHVCHQYTPDGAPHTPLARMTDASPLTEQITRVALTYCQLSPFFSFNCYIKRVWMPSLMQQPPSSVV